jgi:thiamine-phosphate pyrophosphorylase
LRLYLVTDPGVAGIVEATRAALAAAKPGEVGVQVRDKHGGARAIAELAGALLPICRAASAPLLVNDRADVAKALGADGVQLPERGLTIEQARAVLGPAAIIGCSRHDRAGLERAAGASFATLGPIREVPGKGAPIGVAGFARAVRGIALPVFALGGVELGDIAALRASGAAGIATIRGVYGSGDPAAAVRSILDALG